MQPKSAPAIVGRLREWWAISRDTVLAGFPPAPGQPADRAAYLARVDDLYASDAYHSLSIEGYRVTPELIERVSRGEWDPKSNPVDRTTNDALAVRGYWQAFGKVKEAVAGIVDGQRPLREADLTAWYRELFQPAVEVGALPAAVMTGYRRNPVYLGSDFIPPRHEVVRDAMASLFELVDAEPEPAVRAVLGHWMVGYVHPFPDGNGRVARFLMNTMLASGGYPWTVIRMDDRDAYLSALDRASIGQDLKPFTRFIAERTA